MLLDLLLVTPQLILDLVHALIHRRLGGRTDLAGDKVVLVLGRNQDLDIPGLFSLIDRNLNGHQSAEIFEQLLSFVMQVDVAAPDSKHRAESRSRFALIRSFPDPSANLAVSEQWQLQNLTHFRAVGQDYTEAKIIQALFFRTAGPRIDLQPAVNTILGTGCCVTWKTGVARRADPANCVRLRLFWRQGAIEVWVQCYDPLGSWPASTVAAALPVFVLLGLLAWGRLNAAGAALAGLSAACSWRFSFSACRRK